MLKRTIVDVTTHRSIKRFHVYLLSGQEAVVQAETREETFAVHGAWLRFRRAGEIIGEFRKDSIIGLYLEPDGTEADLSRIKPVI